VRVVVLWVREIVLGTKISAPKLARY